MSLKKNVAANFAGQGWSALMSLAFVPLYIKYLGIEAYGLIGIFGLLQAWLTVLDMGMTPALSREMARFTGGAHSAQTIRDLLRSVEILGCCVSLCVCLAVWALSHWLAVNWLRVEKIPLDAVANAFAIMGCVTALRAVEDIYRSSLVGLQRQVVLNLVTSVMATVRGVGAVAVLIWVAPTIEAFFAWQLMVSVASAIAMASVLYSGIPAGKGAARPSLQALAKIWRFAGGVMAITLLSFLLMQLDKILLTRLLTLESFGYYSLAAMLASVLYMMVGPFDSAFFPRFTAQVSLDDQDGLMRTYHLGAQLITVCVGSAAMVLIVFGGELLLLWTGNPELADRLAPLLSVLALGSLLNCFMHMPYQLQLAHGWTRLSIYVNMLAVSLLVPAIFWVAPRYGAIGVAWIWVALNTMYLLISIHFMFRRLLRAEKWRWYFYDVIFPMAAAGLVAVAVRYAFPAATGAMLLLSLGGAFFSVLTVSALSAHLVREQLFVLGRGCLLKIRTVS
jgi:O-antigen/teichoic acid export membrane protein